VCLRGGGWWGDDGVKVTVCQQDKGLGENYHLIGMKILYHRSQFFP